VKTSDRTITKKIVVDKQYPLIKNFSNGPQTIPINTEIYNIVLKVTDIVYKP
jgi:hypothetical protein